VAVDEKELHRLGKMSPSPWARAARHSI
jgi:hypothetical protein